MLTKICTKCKDELPELNIFLIASKDGLASMCKKCLKESQKWYRKNRTEKQKRKKELEEKGLKVCPKCKKELPSTLKYFYRDIGKKDGLTSWCKKCQCQKKHKSKWKPMSI